MRMIGRRMVNAVPRPNIDSAEIAPPCASTIPLTIASPKPGATAAARPRAIDDVKTLEDMRKVAVRDAFAGIAHAQDRIAVARVDLDANAPAAGRVAQRVVDEVDEDLRETVGIGLDAHRAQRRQLERDALVRRLLLERCDDRPRDLFEIDVAQRQLAAAPIRRAPVRAAVRRARSRRSTCASACGTKRSRASSSGASSTVSSISLIDESGVRSSCETLERNSLRARSSRTSAV